MRVLMIRHGRVDMPWAKKYNAKEYDLAWQHYDDCDILPVTGHMEIPREAKVYVSSFKRTHQTAEQYLGVKEYTVLSDLLDEVPLRSFADVKLRMRRRWLDVLGRIQWYLPLKRQPERRKVTRQRADRLIDYLEAQGDGNYVLVMHGFYMRTLGAMFRKRGYRIRNRRIFTVPNLCTVEAVKDREA